MLAEAWRRFRQAALTGGLAVGCVLLGAGSANAAWESPQAIDNGGTGYGATSTTQAAVAVGPNGLTTAFLVQVSPGAPSGSPGNPFLVRRSAGGSTSWSAPAPVSTPAGQVATIPAPVLAAAGGGLPGAGGSQGMFWLQPGSGSAELVSTVWPSTAAGPAAALAMPCTSTPTPECPSQGGGTEHVAFDGSGNAYAVADGATGDILFSHTDPATGNWLPAQALGQGGFPRIAVDAGGDVGVTYVRTDNTIPVNPVNRLYARRELAGQTTFGPEDQISGSGSVNEGGDPFALVIDGSGSATAVFVESPTPVTTVVEAVGWPLSSAAPAPEQQISGAPQTQGPLPAAATAAVDSRGDVTAAWSSSNPSGTIYAAQLVSGTWGPPTQVSPANNRNASNPQIAADAAGTATIVYTDSAPPSGSDVDVKATRMPLGGTWSQPASLRSADSNAGAVQPGSARIAAASPGQVDVIVGQQLSGTNRLFAIRFDDTTPPSIQTVTPQDGASYRQGTTVLADYSCADEAGGSGVASCAGAIPQGQAIDTSSPGANAFTVSASDQAGNTASHTVHYTVQAGPPPKDTTPPRITISVPRDGAVYARGALVSAGFSCSDPDSPVQSCRGSVPNGDPVDTRALGRHSFSVVGQDPAGNTASRTVHYTVARRSQPLSTIRLTVAPRRIRAGHAARLRFHATTCANGRCHALWAALISFHGHTMRTNRQGRATFNVTVRKAGRYVARAREPGYRDGITIVIGRSSR
jgi:hypothetical protein